MKDEIGKRWRHTPRSRLHPVGHRDQLSTTESRDKPPKLRFKPGTFVKDKDGQLYCIRVAYRLKANPREWMYLLEYRNNLDNPQTFMSEVCEALSGEPVDQCVILWEPLYSSMDVGQHDLCRNMYHYGDGKHVFNRDLLNKFKVVSSGEIQGP